MRQAERRLAAWTGALFGLFVEARPDPEQPAVRVGHRAAAVSASFLVRGTVVSAFRTAVGRIMATEQVRILLSGPWPPYSFASDVDHGAASTMERIP